MKGSAGKVFILASEASAGCTQSQALSEDGEAGLVLFDLAAGTGISKESHPSVKIWLVTAGEGAAKADGFDDVRLEAGMAYAAPKGVPSGIETDQGIS